MEFHEKLQELRKNRGLTQEELAEDLYVSRTAISKWESGRGYPSVDSLKSIAAYFSVTIDELLTGEKILTIAEKENQKNIRGLCDLLFGILDVCTLILIVLPLYPNTINGFVASVNLFAYTQITELNRWLYWTLFLALIMTGGIRLCCIRLKTERYHNFMTGLSLGLSIITVLLLATTKEAYALILVFLLLVMKTALLLKYVK